MCTAPGKLVTKKRALKLPSSCAIEFIFNFKTVQLEMLYKTTSWHDFNHTVFKVLKGHPKDIDVEGERSEKKQGWALSAFIKVCEA